jgi:DNA polymerase-4
MSRKILHLDLDAFFCAVEEQSNPDLCGKAFAVGARPEARGVVASCSYPARKFGVRSAMPMSQALRLCPQLVIVDRHMGEYSAVSRQVMAILYQHTPLVEKISIDEAFLDVSALRPTALESACKIQQQINQELDLPCSLGVASNKLVAKIANTIGKASARGDGPPNSIKVVPPGEEADFLASLPVRELWGVGPKTAETLGKMGVQTIGDLAQLPQDMLVKRFGKLGGDLFNRARGIDNRPVETEHETKSVSRETTFTTDIRDAAVLQKTLRALSDSVGRSLRKSELKGHTVKLKLRWADFTTLTRQSRLSHATDMDDEIYRAASELLQTHWQSGQAVRLIGVGVSGFEAVAEQLSLWDDEEDHTEQRALQNTLDELRDRFGEKIIKRGSSIRRRKPRF